MKYIPMLFVALVLAGVAISGCTQSPGGTGSPFQGNSQGGMTPGPTVTLPPEQTVEIQINEKDPIYATIPVSFAGGKGQVAVKDIRIRVTRADGQVTEKHLEPVKGAELKFDGTKETDRIEAWVTLNTGSVYKVVDQLVPYRTRG
ncbi:MAG: hypothetical protein WC502_11560 [Methanolinea sp.]|jgi:hypothetical protein|nr:hypothetical protein [Methanolinea sp.]